MHFSIYLLIASTALERTWTLTLPSQDSNSNDTIVDSRFLNWVYSLDSRADFHSSVENASLAMEDGKALNFEIDIANENRRVQSTFHPCPYLYRVSAKPTNPFRQPEKDYVEKSLRYGWGLETITVRSDEFGRWQSWPHVLSKPKPWNTPLFDWSDVTLNPARAVDFIARRQIKNIFNEMTIVKAPSCLPAFYKNKIYYLFYQVPSQHFYGIVVQVPDGNVVKIVSPPSPAGIPPNPRCENSIEI